MLEILDVLAVDQLLVIAHHLTVGQRCVSVVVVGRLRKETVPFGVEPVAKVKDEV